MKSGLLCNNQDIQSQESIIYYMYMLYFNEIL